MEGRTNMDRLMYDELVRGILEALRGQAVRIVLYGSVARGINTSESDIDIAVFVNVRPEREAEDRLADFKVSRQTKHKVQN